MACHVWTMVHVRYSFAEQRRTRDNFRVRRSLLYTYDMYKVVVFIPVENADALRQAIGDAGGGRIGNYSHCSFSSRGIGRFKTLEGAEPAIGEIGKLEEVEEERIEFVCTEEKLQAVLAAIRKAHPSAEPALDD